MLSWHALPSKLSSHILTELYACRSWHRVCWFTALQPDVAGFSEAHGVGPGGGGDGGGDGDGEVKPPPLAEPGKGPGDPEDVAPPVPQPLQSWSQLLA